MCVSRAKIRPNHVRVIQQVTRGSGPHDRAFLQNVTASSYLESLTRILLNQKHCDPLLIDATNEPHDLLDEQRRESQRGLVKKQEFRTRHQSSTDGNHLLFATGQCPADLPSTFAKAWEHFQHSI